MNTDTELLRNGLKRLRALCNQYGQEPDGNSGDYDTGIQHGQNECAANIVSALEPMEAALSRLLEAGVPEAEVEQSIELAQALGEVGASKVIAERIVQVLCEVEALTEGRTDAFWAGVSMAVDEVAERLQMCPQYEAANHPPSEGE